MPMRRRALALVAGLILAFLVAEVGLRVARMFVPRIHGLTYSPTVRSAYDRIDSTRELLERSYFGYQPLTETPGLRLNAGLPDAGVRGGEGRRRIGMVVLGDSFAFGANGVAYAALWHQVAGRRQSRRRPGGRSR
jgi:hypothetical protein